MRSFLFVWCAFFVVSLLGRLSGVMPTDAALLVDVDSQVAINYIFLFSGRQPNFGYQLRRLVKLFYQTFKQRTLNTMEGDALEGMSQFSPPCQSRSVTRSALGFRAT
jgi:hypothetical protein